MRRPWFVWAILIVTIGASGCHTYTISVAKDTKTEVMGTVTKLIRAKDGSFRYYGSVHLTGPTRYHNKEVGLFIISHERDAREFIGKRISASFADYDLTRSVEPPPDPFIVSSPEPQISLELVAGRFSPLDYAHYTELVTAQGIIRGYQADKNEENLHFMFDVGYSGDSALVEVVEPAKYRGVFLHVLVYDGFRNGVIRRPQWNRIGTSVGFTVSESVLAWEPWGFVPIEQLGDVSFQAEAAQTTHTP